MPEVIENLQKNAIFIIAEAGVNHNGDPELARKLAEAAAEAGADAVKFQTFTADNLVSKKAPKAEYQNRSTSPEESQYEMIRGLELSRETHEELISYCREKDIEFLSTPFDLKSIDLLDYLGLQTFKVGSGEITNLPYLRKIGGLQKQVILSSGMSDLGEIEDALQVLEEAGTKRDKITVLHCNTEYPTPMQDVNLRAMQTIAAAFPGIRVGYSDHTQGIEVPIAAAALGATVIEKHFTLDKDLEGPDHRASLEPDELTKMVKAIRNIEDAMGSGIKAPSPSELKNKAVARKSIVAARTIQKGELFREENLTVKRPGTGISPMRWEEVLGRPAAQEFAPDDLINIL
ncbi:MAG: N-acetylneuraminate synthase [Desulfosudaceae bacterium]